jgi:hypothetical protein
LDHDQTLQLGYLLALLVLPVVALIHRFTPGGGKRQRFTAQLGDRTYEGEYWSENGIVFVRCPAGQGSRLMGVQQAGRVAEELLIDIYRDQGLLEA